MNYILPIIITLIISVSSLRKKNTYTDFTDGAADGLRILAGIFPPLLAITVASSMLRASGAFDMISKLITPFSEKLNIPSEVIPLALMRPVSGSGSLAILSDTLSTYGPDTRIGKIASVIMASTETTFYCIGIYFSKTEVKNTSKVILCAVIGDLCAVLLACFII